MPLPGIILLASCNVPLNTEDGPARTPMFTPDPPLGLYRIEKWLMDHGTARVLVVDPNVEGNIKQTIQEFTAEGPVPLVGVNLSRYYLRHDCANIVQVRDWVEEAGGVRPVTLSGGYESTLGPDLVLSLGYVDGVAKGFGEFPLQALLEAAGDKEPERMVEAVMGAVHPCLQWREDIAPGAELKPAADHSPADLYTVKAHPVEEIPWAEYWTRTARLEDKDDLPLVLKAGHAVTCSHCLGVCGFCSSRRYGKEVLGSYGMPPTVLMMSAEDAEQLVLDFYDKVGVGGVYFVDDDFVVGGKVGMRRFEAFCTAMEAHYESGRLPRTFWLGMQTKTRHFAPGPAAFSGGGPESLKRLRRSGFKLLEYGVESLDDEVLKSPFINKQTSAEVNYQVVSQSLDAGLKTSIFYIPFPPTIRPENFANSLDKLIGLLEKGARLGLSPSVRIFSGSPAEAMASDPTYTYRTKTLQRADGSEVVLPDVFLPCDPNIAKALGDAIKRNYSALKSLRRERNPGFMLLSDVARDLGFPELAARVDSLNRAEGN